jgi:hypothetical protein
MNRAELGRSSDPDDLIFPRTATRIGTKFQVNVPPSLETDNHSSGTIFAKYLPLRAKSI